MATLPFFAITIQHYGPIKISANKRIRRIFYLH